MKELLKPLAYTAVMATSVNAGIVINEVSYLGASGSDQIELLNTGASSVDISSWWICSRFSYSQLTALTLDSGSLNIAAGQLTVLTVNFDLNNTSADLGLFNTNSFSTALAMEDFVQWGTSVDVGRVDVAVAKGIWGEGATGVYDFVATAGAGETVQYGGSGNGVANWSNATNTIGAVNAVPEPSSTLLIGLSCFAVVLRRRK